MFLIPPWPCTLVLMPKTPSSTSSPDWILISLCILSHLVLGELPAACRTVGHVSSVPLQPLTSIWVYFLHLRVPSICWLPLLCPSCWEQLGVHLFQEVLKPGAQAHESTVLSLWTLGIKHLPNVIGKIRKTTTSDSNFLFVPLFILPSFFLR